MTKRGSLPRVKSSIPRRITQLNSTRPAAPQTHRGRRPTTRLCCRMRSRTSGTEAACRRRSSRRQRTRARRWLAGCASSAGQTRPASPDRDFRRKERRLTRTRWRPAEIRRSRIRGSGSHAASSQAGQADRFDRLYKAVGRRGQATNDSRSYREIPRSPELRCTVPGACLEVPDQDGFQLDGRRAGAVIGY